MDLTRSTDSRHLDVLIVGAGLSGIGAAYHLQTQCPGKSYAILEGRERMGGTWDLFRYPGIRSDSDMYTLGYSFKPWTDAKAIADGPSILEYIRETAEENGIDRHIRYGHRVVGAHWSSEDARWTLDVETSDGQSLELTCNFVFMCSGYYDYDRGYEPAFPGSDRFGGEIVHPQKWPEDLDYAGKRVVIIGSGATAVTLLPAMAETAEHVTMLQRSPTYMLTLPARDPVADWLRDHLPMKTAYSMVRWKNVVMAMAMYAYCRRFPRHSRKFLMGLVKRQIGDHVDVDTHFNPKYDPWDQRLCFVPDEDLFEAIRQGRASVVTDHVDTFTEKGIRLESGEELEADIIVTATGLRLKILGGLELEVDGERIAPADTMAYKGTMLSGVPNAVMALGYTNASWTLKCDLSTEWACRLLQHMDDKGYDTVRPRRDPDMDEQPILDLAAGYVQRAIDQLPRQGTASPWRLYQNYFLDRFLFRHTKIEDGVLELSRSRRQARGSQSSSRASRVASQASRAV